MQDQLTLVGHLGGDPERTTTPWGEMQAVFRLATTRRRQNHETREWEDGHTNWYTVRCGKRLGENVLVSLRRGQRVVVVGRLTIRPWTTDASRGTAIDLDAESVGVELSVHALAGAPSGAQTRTRPPGDAEGAPAAGPHGSGGTAPSVDASAWPGDRQAVGAGADLEPPF